MHFKCCRCIYFALGFRFPEPRKKELSVVLVRKLRSIKITCPPYMPNGVLVCGVDAKVRERQDKLPCCLAISTDCRSCLASSWPSLSARCHDDNKMMAQSPSLSVVYSIQYTVYSRCWHTSKPKLKLESSFVLEGDGEGAWHFWTECRAFAK